MYRKLAAESYIILIHNQHRTRLSNEFCILELDPLSTLARRDSLS